MNIYHLDDIPDDLKGYFEPAPQLGLEATPDAYVAALVGVFGEVRRVLRDDGTCWIVIADSYNAYNGNRGRSTSFQAATEDAMPDLPGGAGLTCKSLKPKDLVGIPWRVAFALQADGWWLRQDIIWAKPNPMPESVTDRCTKAHEYIFLLSKSATYHYDAEAVKERSTDAESHEGYRERGERRTVAADPDQFRTRVGFASMPGKTYPTRNRRSVWTVATRPYSGAHFATFPPKLVEPCILAGCPEGGTVLDPFAGSGTTLAVAMEHGRDAIGIELNAEYIDLARRRLGEAKEAAGLRAVAWELSSTPLTGAKR
jgi:DNA modification methylase